MQLRFGVQPAKRKKSDLPGNIQSHYRTLLLGWIFDPNSASGALWRHWVESRFGLLTRYHHTPIAEPDSVDYLHYLTLTTSVFTDHQGLFEQLDFLYFYCQLELKLRMSHQTHLVLYRGFSNLDIQQLEGESVAHLNNLSSLSSDPEMAFQFGTHIVRVSVPLYKVVCFDSLLPRILHGEQEYMVLGGLYQVERLTDVR
jgi:NAD+--dinitrogen-reductase ADP-D-ribosyltransferase